VVKKPVQGNRSYADKLGRVVKNEEKSATKARVTFCGYTPLGDPASQSVTAGGKTQTTRYAYDGVGHLIHVWDSLGQDFDYGYNRAGQVTDVKIDEMKQRSNAFNEIGLLGRKVLISHILSHRQVMFGVRCGRLFPSASKPSL